MLSLAHGQVAPERMAAALVCYRMIAFVAPVALGLAAAAFLEASGRRRDESGGAPPPDGGG